MASRVFFFLFYFVSSGIGHSFDTALNPDSEDIQWPSCEELRNLWLSLRRVTYHGEITNEIPLIPTDLLRNLQGHRHRGVHSKNIPLSEKQGFNTLFPNVWNKDKVYSRPTDVSAIGKLFPPIDILPPLPKAPILQPRPLNNIALENEGFFGRFESGFRVPEEQLYFPEEPIIEEQLPPISIKEHNIFGSINQDSANKKQIPTFDGIYGLEEDAGSFGDFYAEEKPQSQRKPDIRTVKLGNERWHSQPSLVESRPEAPGIRYVLDTCDALEKMPCSTNDNCACLGWETLQCINGKCRVIRDTMTGRIEDMGAWHDGPLASSQLGMVTQKRRRGKRSKLM